MIIKILDVEMQKVQKEKFMKFIFLGKYSKEGLTGFINNPSQDRKSIISSMMKKAGGTLDELFLTRGAYDVVVIGSANDFETVGCH